MTIDELIKQLTKARELVGCDKKIPVVRVNYGENDYILPSYVVVADIVDQDGEKYDCAIVGDSGGEELTKVGIAHYEWKPEKDKLN